MTPEIILKTIFSALLAANLVGNTLVIIVILKNRAMRTPMNYLLLNLALADMVVGLFFAPSILFMSIFTHPVGLAGDVLCKFITGKNFAWLASLTSAYSLVLVAIERFYAIIYPLKRNHKITKKKVKVLVAVCWMLATLVTTPSFYADKYKDGSKSCSERLPHRWQNVSYSTVWMLNSAVLPGGVILILYLKVIYALWFKHSAENVRHRAVISARRNITKMMIIVSIIYILCCFPTNITYFLYIFYAEWFPSGEWFFTASYCLLVFNSSINPFIYTFQSRRFRRYLKKLIRCKCTV